MSALNPRMSRRTLLAAAGALGVATLAAGRLGVARAENAAPAGQALTPGTYTASATGFHGPVTLAVTVDENSVTSVEVVESTETYDAGRIALERLCAEIVEAQSLGIDAVAGATLTSVAFFQAAEDCLSQAGADLSAWEQSVEKTRSETAEKVEADVVVVGSGIAGWSAAVAASQRGAKVVVLEKLGLEGGNAKFSLGTFMICQVPENKEFHIRDEDDTLEDAIARWEDYQAESGVDSPYPDYDRVASNLVQTMYTVDWLKSLGAEFEYASNYKDGKMSMAQVAIPGDDSDSTPVSKLMGLYKRTAVANGAELRINTPATGLIVEDGKVVGVRADGPEGELEIRAKSVILASGGFGASQDLISEQMPEAGDVTYVGARGANGDGIAMAKEVGAAPYEDGWVLPTPICPANTFFLSNERSFMFEEINPMFDDADSDTTYHRLVVDRDGNRFMNEAGHYAQQNVTLANLAIGPYWALYDNLDAEKAEVMESGLNTETVFKADTVEDVAQAADLDPDALAASVAAYNEACVAGVDKDYEKPAEYLDKPVGETGPYYLMQVVVSASDTLGGIKTNERREVLDEGGKAIEGLYAVGSTQNKVCYNRMYFSGSSLTFCATDGRIAGAAATGAADPLAYPLA